MKLLLIEELVSEALRLGFVVGLVNTGDEDLGPAMLINVLCIYVVIVSCGEVG